MLGRTTSATGLDFKVDVKLIAKATRLAYEGKKVAKVSNGKYQDYIENRRLRDSTMVILGFYFLPHTIMCAILL